MIKEISSTQNPTIKSLAALQDKARERRKSGEFLIEGVREINLALQAGFQLTRILFCDAIANAEELQLLQSKLDENITQIAVTEEVYKKIAYRSTTEGIVVSAKAKQNQLNDLQLPENPLILVAEAPEKPGNIGALLRTADAAGVDAFILANPLTDLYNPNIIRSSVGGVFTTQIATGTTEEVLTYLKAKNIAIYAAVLQEAISYEKQDFISPTAIVVGTEADGLSEEWRKESTQNIIIPMQGKIDSMNVSVAASILIFEARRQRGFKK
ncbi:RNA methyltransferase, TrmH family [Leeuwenhoekiella marinoflava DSM 3653]|uniref:TrmH family RNA methyltransferase n=2 Tax=Leeuwenhoekiella marinoflava TaxID=988 RepID=A0A4V1KST2_9FLAO|nr:TrmH family RNA methyltransferase [Leeuwenhoekiella marinoflava]SHE58175.1 RNA methyltransferase, TrmH family [Leeuwenhoekiella marinoflava DSM 3653]